jgi:hypothetical protein
MAAAAAVVANPRVLAAAAAEADRAWAWAAAAAAVAAARRNRGAPIMPRPTAAAAGPSPDTSAALRTFHCDSARRAERPNVEDRWTVMVTQENGATNNQALRNGERKHGKHVADTHSTRIRLDFVAPETSNFPAH